MIKPAAIVLIFALLFFGCAVPAWQRPEGHPADPLAAADGGPPGTPDALERYRGSMLPDAGGAGTEGARREGPGRSGGAAP